MTKITKKKKRAPRKRGAKPWVAWTHAYEPDLFAEGPQVFYTTKRDALVWFKKVRRVRITIIEPKAPAKKARRKP